VQGHGRLADTAGWVHCDVGRDTDVTPPSFVDTYPTVTSVTGSSIEISVALDEPGWVYYVVMDNTNSPASPTPAEVVAMTGAGGATPTVAGRIAVGVANAVNGASPGGQGSGLQREHPYKVFIVAQDVSASQNVQATVVARTVTTKAAGPGVCGSMCCASAALCVGGWVAVCVALTLLCPSVHRWLPRHQIRHRHRRVLRRAAVDYWRRVLRGSGDHGHGADNE